MEHGHEKVSPERSSKINLKFFLYLCIQSSSSSAYDESEYIEAFNQMKRSAGVDEVEDVIERFRTQGQTSEILATQNERAKDDVMKLSQTKEQLQSTWEKVRFAFDSSLNQLLFFIIIFQDTLVKVRT